MEWIGNAIEAGSVAFAVVTYICDKVFQRKQRTIEKLCEIRNSYHDNIAGKDKKGEKDYYRNCVKFFSDVEQFCSGVLTHYYSYKIAEKNGSRFITMLYKDFKDYLIEQRRTMFKNDDYYQNLEKLVEKFSKKNKAGD